MSNIDLQTRVIFPRGSEWRRWDLHIHSDASDGKITCEQIVAEAKRKQLAVIALTDHHTTRNIDRIRKIAIDNGICALGGIEFRTEYGNKSVHMIGIFPDNFEVYELDSKNLEDLILNPLGLSEAKISAAGKKSFTKKGNSAPSEADAFREGIFLVQVEFKKAADLIHKYGGLVIVHAGSKENSVEREMKHLGKPGVTLANSLGPVKEELFTSGYIDICEIRKENDDESFYLSNFKKPSISSSDAHEASSIGSRFAWIKADPCFAGLRTIIHEPDSRVFLGEKPELFDRVARNGTKYLSRLVIEAVSNYDGRNGKWFANTKIEFGHELTVIIGNKGSGKSAITDILGLCGHSRHSSHFSFLKPERFLERGHAENFRACLEWVAEDVKTSKLLNEPVDKTAPEDVLYLPQGYFEEVCNEIENLVEFKKEINSVVFQHIPEEDRLGKSTFDEFLRYKRNSIDHVVASKKQALHEVNVDIALLEKKRNPTYKSKLSKQLQIKQSELDALPKPKKVPLPKNVKNRDLSSKSILEEIKDLTKKIALSKRQVTRFRSRILRHNNQLEILKQFHRELSQKKQDLDSFVQYFVTKIKDIKEIDVKKIISYKFDISPIKKVIVELEKKITADGITLSEESVKDDSGTEVSQVFALSEMEHRILKLQSKLDEPNKNYQKYQKDLKSCKERSAKIVGNLKTPGTLKYFEAQLKYLEKPLDKDIEKKRIKRIGLVEEIFNAKKEIIEIYGQLKRFIDKVITKNQNRFENHQINILAEFVLSNNIVSNILQFISKNVIGTYRGADSAEKQLLSNIEQIDPNHEESIVNFLDRMILSLERDERTDALEQRFIDDQIQDQVSFYDYIFSLEYIKENYELKLGDKKLEKLSPGEKGALLVVFYLLLDKSEKPLILDQPEDNLDNESVSRILVPFIKEARKRRQIIMVTHNPNLAVYADAEQVIRVEIEKDKDNVFHHYSGGIDNDLIREHIINVLEGTMPAFDNRSMKYKAK